MVPRSRMDAEENVFPGSTFKDTQGPLKPRSYRTRLYLKLEVEFNIIIHWGPAFAGIQEASVSESWRLAPGFQKSPESWHCVAWLGSLERDPEKPLHRAWKVRDQDVGNSRTVLVHWEKLASTKWIKPKIKVICAVGDRTGVLVLPKFRAQTIASWAPHARHGAIGLGVCSAGGFVLFCFNPIFPCCSPIFPLWDRDVYFFVIVY